MTIENWLSRVCKILDSQNVATARLDALVLLEDATGKDRAWLLAHPDYEIETEALDKQIARRARHEPLAYIRGKTEFYGREFAVNAHTLEPRPETETMIDLLKKYYQPGMSMIDVGTGSGAIGITAALELDTDQVTLIDIDEDALAVARDNCKSFAIKLKVEKGDLLSQHRAPYDIILANLPYVPDSHTINQAAMQEPPHAIFGGQDGLDLYRRMFEQLQGPRYVFSESLPFQHTELAKIASKAGYQQLYEDDFIQVFSR